MKGINSRRTWWQISDSKLITEKNLTTTISGYNWHVTWQLTKNKTSTLNDSMYLGRNASQIRKEKSVEALSTSCQDICCFLFSILQNMSEEWEFYRAMRERSQQRKHSNYVKSKKILDDNDIQYIEKPNGHIIVWDWQIWLSTWKIYNPKTKKHSRWIFNFLKKIQKDAI